ncbi:hypothetical protein Drorol1_Dr00016813 [Drosera rotundifolia]
MGSVSMRCCVSLHEVDKWVLYQFRNSSSFFFFLVLLLDLAVHAENADLLRLVVEAVHAEDTVTCPKGVEAEIPSREDRLGAFFEAGKRQFQHDGEAPKPVLSV